MLDTNEIAEIETLITNGLVTKRKHPNMDIWICNYTPRMQYISAWTPVAEQCRGLIVDGDWNIIARPFKKFYNLGEKLELADLPDHIPRICEKLDGFLGILYNEHDLPAIATRGSFESPMAIWATQWIRNTGLSMKDFLDEYTYIFEIIDEDLCRSERLIVDYGRRTECVLLAVIETATGLEIDHVIEANDIGLPFAKVCNVSLNSAILEMSSMRAVEQEGYVCKWPNGFRIKLKADEYKKLHRLLSGLTPKRILNALIESGQDGLDEMLGEIPDEFYDRVRNTVAKIREEQTRLIEEGQMLYRNTGGTRDDVERATVIHRTPNNAVAFAILNRRSNGDVAMVALKGVRKTINELCTGEKDGHTTGLKQDHIVVSSSGD